VPGFPPVHRLSNLEDFDQTAWCDVPAGIDEARRTSRTSRSCLASSSAWVLPEKRDHRLYQIPAPTHDVPVQMLAMVVVPTIRDDLSHTEELTDPLQRSDALRALRHGELVSNLVPDSVASSPRAILLSHDADREASFSVYKTDHPATELIRPFLLVFRTRHVVTLDVASDSFE
jgi:hypothetical protein